MGGPAFTGQKNTPFGVFFLSGRTKPQNYCLDEEVVVPLGFVAVPVKLPEPLPVTDRVPLTPRVLFPVLVSPVDVMVEVEKDDTLLDTEEVPPLEELPEEELPEVELFDEVPENPPKVAIDGTPVPGVWLEVVVVVLLVTPFLDVTDMVEVEDTLLEN